MLKPFVEREVKDEIAVEMIINEVKPENNFEVMSSEFPHANSEILKNLPEYLKHLDGKELQQIIDVVIEFKDLFRDDPGRTNIIEHDVDVGEAKPIKQGPYRLNPNKKEIVNKEVDYMLKHNLIKASCSSWSSPVVLVPKERGQHVQYRLCFDYRKLNNVTKSDSYPMPRVDECIDKIGNAKYISKFDLLKGYWQVGLTPRAQAVSAFVTNNGLYECKVMPFAMKNASATFQRLMNFITQGLEGCVIYIDDIIIYSDD